MSRIKKEPISTFIGLLFILASMVLLFVETNYEIPLYALGGVSVLGILLLFAKDKLIDILTMGVSRLVNDTAKATKLIGGDPPPPTEEDEE